MKYAYTNFYYNVLNNKSYNPLKLLLSQLSLGILYLDFILIQIIYIDLDIFSIYFQSEITATKTQLLYSRVG